MADLGVHGLRLAAMVGALRLPPGRGGDSLRVEEGEKEGSCRRRRLGTGQGQHGRPGICTRRPPSLPPVPRL